jgi:inner membrane protein involved in colicin E2 resistance
MKILKMIVSVPLAFILGLLFSLLLVIIIPIVLARDIIDDIWREYESYNDCD